MIGAGDGSRPSIKTGSRIETAEAGSSTLGGAEELRLRVQQLSLREQIERNHFLLSGSTPRARGSFRALKGATYLMHRRIIANLIGWKMPFLTIAPPSKTFPGVVVGC